MKSAIIQLSNSTMETTHNLITSVALKRLLVELKEKRPDIGVHFRQIGELWSEHFMQIVMVTDHGVILNEEISNEMFIIQNLNLVMQFELDNRFQNYQPYYHYDVHPSTEFS